ncbi:hypothetical protein PV336_16000 [Streptomyces sp. MI02-2A]|uniref:hypothetical protein n=1 Tax=Streptomyces sp. MI02-2A TaxID=3028688 RepID=UPI00299FE033|nr:hypothetical protein [Streptomyces sp. MI02-2A]MDX3260723.1 hypothetical protein [Streptomyces sp. MI02-2A]
MGSHAYARLGYGYDLGGDEGEFKTREDIESLDWYDEDLGLEESAKKVIGEFLTPEESKGVHFQTYGNLSYGYTGTMLFTGPSLSRNWVAEIEIPEITDEHRHRLTVVLETLGITPDQEEPRWLLATHYG